MYVGGINYNTGPYNINIPAEETYVLFNVTIIDDNIREENESFHLVINTTQELPDRIYFGENLSTIISIEDDDGMRLCYYNNN